MRLYFFVQSNPLRVLGQFVVTGPLKWLGWLTTMVMAAAVVAMGVAVFS
jgi:hypothetical protein